MKKKLQGVILVVGIIGSIFAYATTPQVYNSYQRGEVACDGPYRDCYIPPAASAVRGGGDVPPVAVPLLMLDLQPFVVPGVGAS